LTAHAHPLALLLAAHGERRPGAANDAIVRLAAILRGRGVADEIAYGFISGTPGIADAVTAFVSPDVLVWPVFLADGYFTRVRLRQLVAEAANSRHSAIRLQPPLGLDPALPTLIAEKAVAAARQRDFTTTVDVILLAHGSSNNPASHRATENLASAVERQRQFSSVGIAFLDEAPSLRDALARVRGPAVIVGLFTGDGLHGADDVPRLISERRRSDLAFAGNVGTWPELADIACGVISRNRMSAG